MNPLFAQGEENKNASKEQLKAQAERAAFLKKFMIKRKTTQKVDLSQATNKKDQPPIQYETLSTGKKRVIQPVSLEDDWIPEKFKGMKTKVEKKYLTPKNIIKYCTALWVDYSQEFAKKHNINPNLISKELPSQIRNILITHFDKERVSVSKSKHQNSSDDQLLLLLQLMESFLYQRFVAGKDVVTPLPTKLRKEFEGEADVPKSLDDFLENYIDEDVEEDKREFKKIARSTIPIEKNYMGRLIQYINENFFFFAAFFFILMIIGAALRKK